MAYKTKAQQAAIKIEGRRVIELVRNMKKSEVLSVTTPLIARQLSSWLEYVQDADGYHKSFRCQTTNVGEVTMFCQASYKISAVHTQTTTL